MILFSPFRMLNQECSSLYWLEDGVNVRTTFYPGAHFPKDILKKIIPNVLFEKILSNSRTSLVNYERLPGRFEPSEGSLQMRVNGEPLTVVYKTSDRFGVVSVLSGTMDEEENRRICLLSETEAVRETFFSYLCSTRQLIEE